MPVAMDPRGLKGAITLTLPPGGGGPRQGTQRELAWATRKLGLCGVIATFIGLCRPCYRARGRGLGIFATREAIFVKKIRRAC